MTFTTLFVATSVVALPAFACDMHGGGFGFGNPNASWQSYQPLASTLDPAFMDDRKSEMVTPAPAKKARPSFSNATNRAVVTAKARVAKKMKAEAGKTSKKTPVKKEALILDADR